MGLFTEIYRKIKGILDESTTIDADDALWTPDDVQDAANAAQTQICERLLLITDFETPEVCRIDVEKVGGVYVRTYPLSPLVIQVEEIRYRKLSSTTGYPLAKITSLLDMNRHDPDWMYLSGTPQAALMINGAKKISLNRLPTEDAEITLFVKRRPLVDMTLGDAQSATEIDGYDDAIIAGALARLYMKSDKGATLNVAEANKWENRYNEAIADKLREIAAYAPTAGPTIPERW